MHRFVRSAVLPMAKHEPAVHGVHAAAPAMLKKPKGQAKPTAVSVALATDCIVLTLYEPSPPEPTAAVMVDEDSDCDMLTVYSPAPKSAVILVPAIGPDSVIPTAKVPYEIAVMFNVEAEIEPVAIGTRAATNPTGLPTLPVVCAELTVYVPTPPVPLTNAVIIVGAATPAPVTAMLTARAPNETAVTVSVVDEMKPITDADERKVPDAPPPTLITMPGTRVPEEMDVTMRVEAEMKPVTTAEPEPTGQYVPDGQRAPTGVVAPAKHIVPALQGFAVGDTLPTRVQKPAAHGPEHALVARPTDAPKTPGGHGVAVAADVPAAQKKPIGH